MPPQAAACETLLAAVATTAYHSTVIIVWPLKPQQGRRWPRAPLKLERDEE